MSLDDQTINRERGGVRLAAVLDRVGTQLLHWAWPTDAVPDVPVRSVILHDPNDPLGDATAAIVLVPGMRINEDISDLLLSCQQQGCASVVLRRRGGDISAAAGAAAQLGLPLLTIDDDISWEQALSVLTSSLGSAGAGSGSIWGDSLFDLANSTAARTGAAVSIENLDRSIVAYSSVAGQRIDALRQEGILSRRVPEVDHNLARYRTLFDSGDVEHFDAKGDVLPRTAVAIMAGRRPLGSVWVVDPIHGIGTADEQVLRETAELAALHMLRQRSEQEMRLQLRENVVMGALDGRWKARETTSRLGLGSSPDLGLVAFAPLPDTSSLLALIPYLQSAVARFVATVRPDAGLASTSSAVYVLLPTGGTGAAERLALAGLRALAGTFGGQPRAAFSSTVRSVADLPLHRREVDDVLRATVGDSRLPRVCSIETVRSQVLLDRVGAELRAEPLLRDPAIADLLDSDATKGTEHVATLLTWFRSLGEVAAAAAELRIHPNTLRYRLQRIESQFAVKLSHPTDRLAIWLQLEAAVAGAGE